ncbi:uncharacterized protein BX663DRAFT_509619 [Cokeromyces recurvatus]|uniref:uncharacterized protein n=1 Tax=Cokeromyces recurvatus TaxID=90255 RepID=UPI002220A588|nr:uncharacterized protein BX663DRAFT_509619 [Cokeromyces recurvatus]KAI7903119.1 hypothetical protein BX663DRAFT_509619 [Cokeromyces recurvatus]
MLAGLRSQKEAGDLLSTYLLQGWVMTDEICKIDDCSFPLMRSKDGSLSFCTHHDELPANGANHHYEVKQKNIKNEQAQNSDPLKKESTQATVDFTEEELRLRRERRDQSSRASQLIGQKMLQRWTLLNDHCPNESCYAIPLVRNPETNERYCVICENVILTEQEILKYKEQEEERKKKSKEVKVQKPVESPPVIKEHKRQKLEPVKASFSSNHTISTLSMKMNELSERVALCHDPVELEQLFKSIKQCASAIKACNEISKICDQTL